MHRLVDTSQRGNCKPVTNLIPNSNASFSLGSSQKSLSYINLQKQHDANFGLLEHLAKSAFGIFKVNKLNQDEDV